MWMFLYLLFQGFQLQHVIRQHLYQLRADSLGRFASGLRGLLFSGKVWETKHIGGITGHLN
jgi:hypothetical protein